jgi:hypothetical protein
MPSTPESAAIMYEAGQVAREDLAISPSAFDRYSPEDGSGLSRLVWISNIAS